MQNNSSVGFFRYFKKYIGNHIYGYLIINFLVGLFDGLGLAMFVPLLSIATKSTDNRESLGKLQFLVDLVHAAGFELNLVTALVIMVILFILKGLATYFRGLYFTKIKLKFSSTIRYHLVEGLDFLSYDGFTKLDAGRMQNVMVGEINRMATAMIQYFSAVQNVIMLLTYLILATLSNWQFAVLVGIGGVLTNFVYRYINKVTKEKSKNLSFIGHIFNGQLIQAINNFKYLRATENFRIFAKKLRKIVKDGEDVNYKMGQISSFAESIREPIIILIIAVVIIVQVNVLGGNFTTILVSLLLFYRALSHLVLMQNQWNAFLSNSGALESVDELIDDFYLYREKSSDKTISEISDLKIENLRLSYGDKEVLNDINMLIGCKTSIALVGESGAGKTSLANVITGIIPPTAGKIFTADSSVYDSDLKSYRNKIGYISQEPVIFDDTIFNNVTLWSEKNHTNLEKFNSIIDLVSLRSFMNSHTLKEDIPLGNNGILISGGQKQRISIARELFKDVDLLIMDEATSALDSETEKYIKDNIDMLHGRYTMIIIAHRLSTIRNVDSIYLIENGRIIGSGNYTSLIETSPKFKRMVELQEV